MMIVADKDVSLVRPVPATCWSRKPGMAIGSGGNYALAAPGPWSIPIRTPKPSSADRWISRDIVLYQSQCDHRDVQGG